MKFKVNYVFEFKTNMSRKVHNIGTIGFVCLFGVYSQIRYFIAFTNKCVTVRLPVKYVFKLQTTVVLLGAEDLRIGKTNNSDESKAMC